MTDIAAQLEHLVRVGSTKGCTVWLSMVTPTLARAARRIRQLEDQCNKTSADGAAELEKSPSRATTDSGEPGIGLFDAPTAMERD